MTLYLKYRPQTIDDLDLASVRESLSTIIKSGQIPHAFLFSGPKGTGKTSSARILAKIINCETLAKKDKRKKEIKPCSKCDACTTIMNGNNLDVIELDAASNRGIDDIRALKEAIKLSPAKSEKKIYIMDEAHMLTLEAANALLKTLEEPPSHVIFILATTNPEKLPETIRSRTTNVVFGKATNEEIERSIKRVAKGEKIKIDSDVVSIIASFANGSFRDAVKTFEQLVTEKVKLTPEKVGFFLNKAVASDVDQLLELLSERKTKESLLEVEKFIENGGQARNLVDLLVSQLREGILGKIGIKKDVIPQLNQEEIIKLIELMVTASNEKVHSIEQLPLEIAIVKWCTSNSSESKNETKEEELVEEKEIKEVVSKPPVIIKNVEKEEEPVIKKVNFTGKNIDDEMWQKILVAIKPLNSSTEALLRAAKPLGFDGDILTVGVFYSFHKEKLEENQHKMLLEDVCRDLLGNPVRISTMLTTPPAKKIIEEASQDVVLTETTPSLTNSGNGDIIEAAKEIFGA